MWEVAIGRDDRDSLLAARPNAVREPELWWVLNCSDRLLLAQMGQRRRGDPAWAPLPDGTGTVGRHLFVWAFLAVVPHVRDYHATIGLSDDESWDSLQTLGEELALSRRLTRRVPAGREPLSEAASDASFDRGVEVVEQFPERATASRVTRG
ncbi:acyltransferase domain-containing protein [Kribbella sp. NPDC049584]|uniref:acyltransferase domain-containing protein n=1 Tax=Kribbella sp. NPDC049584 TaxID=3154833 RepID=UPI00341B6C8E